MLRFNRDVWTTCFYWKGGITRCVYRISLLYLAYTCFLYYFQQALGIKAVDIEPSNIHAIVSFMVFLLVFRLNSVSSRHKQGVSAFLNLFGVLESLLTVLITNLNGPSPTLDEETYLQQLEMTITAKMNFVRLILAYAVGIGIHCGVLDSMENQGELDEETLHELVFLHHRLQGLLYAEEMNVVDKALMISYERAEKKKSEDEDSSFFRRWVPPAVQRFIADDDGDDGIFRAEIARHRVHEDFHGEALLGGSEARCNGDAECELGAEEGEGVVVAPVPKVLLAMLIGAMRQPLLQPWGYPERMLNVTVAASQNLVDMVSDIGAVCTVPTPLPYVQLSHILMLSFAVLYPLSIDMDSGFVDNVIMPAAIFFVIQGFEHLAKMMESPTGHDATDINPMEMIHSIEVAAKYVFDVSSCHRPSLEKCLMRPLESFSLTNGEKYLEAQKAKRTVVPPSKMPSLQFDHYFRWVPIPTLILDDLLQAHGHVDVLAAAEGKPLRALLRQSFTRRHDGYDQLGASTKEEQQAQEMVTAIRTDPNIFCFYLTFNGIHRHNHPPPDNDPAIPKLVGETLEYRRHLRWKDRVVRLLKNHSAASLFDNQDPVDTDRSVLGFGALQSVALGSTVVASGYSARTLQPETNKSKMAEQPSTSGDNARPSVETLSVQQPVALPSSTVAAAPTVEVVARLHVTVAEQETAGATRPTSPASSASSPLHAEQKSTVVSIPLFTDQASVAPAAATPAVAAETSTPPHEVKTAALQALSALPLSQPETTFSVAATSPLADQATSAPAATFLASPAAAGTPAHGVKTVDVRESEFDTAAALASTPLLSTGLRPLVAEAASSGTLPSIEMATSVAADRPSPMLRFSSTEVAQPYTPILSEGGQAATPIGLWSIAHASTASPLRRTQDLEFGFGTRFSQ